MKLLQLGAAVVLMAAPAGVFAQPGDDVDRYDTSVEGEPVASVEVFYDQLSPYGMWVDDQDFGQVFIPEHKQFVPYTQGHWQYTSVGFVWISAEPFDWATAHYGRWAYSRSYGRWIWRPDTVWGPSWVEWRQAGDDFGWAPLAPDIAVRIGYSPPIESWHYCSAAHVLDTNVVRYYEPPRRVIEIHREARPIEHYAQISGARVVVGPSTATLHEHHVVVRPTKIELHATGRLAPAEARTAVTHAEAHHAANEAQNRKRIESNPAIHQVAVRAAAAPHHGEGAPAAVPPQVQPEHKPAQPEHGQPQVDHKQPPQPEHKPAQPEHGQPQIDHKQPPQPEHKPAQPEHGQPQVDHKQPPQPEHKPAPPVVQPQVDHKQPPQPEHKPATPQAPPARTQPPQQAQPEHKPALPQAQPERKPPQPAQPPQAEHRQPEHNQPPPAAEHRPEPRPEPKQKDQRPEPDHK